MRQVVYGAAATLVLMATAAQEVAAQQEQFPSVSSTGQPLNGPIVPTAPTRPKDAAPPAIPGAQPNGVVPAERSTSDMQPTEALFDAIDRGDIAAARDAITRGADLDGKNVLGLSPLELSVDLRRNDISFLLLSLRGSGRHAAPPATAAAAAPLPHRTGSRTARAPVVAPAAPPQLAKQFAGDGGAPIPDSGFLGFDRGTQR